MPTFLRLSGFTLIELIVVVAIIATLVVIAVPSYQASLVKARRLDAIIALEQAAARQEQYYFTQHSYSHDMEAIGGDGGDWIISPQGYYQLTVIADTNAFTLIASPVEGGAQGADSDCLSISLTNTGVKEPAVCWQ